MADAMASPAPSTVPAEDDADQQRLALVRLEIKRIRAEIEATETEISTVNAELEELHEQEEEDIRRAQSTSGVNVSAKARAAKKIFNEQSARKGITALLDCGEIPEKTPDAVATFLFETRGLNKAQIGEYLGDHSEFHQEVLSAFSNKHDFKDKPFVEGLRAYLWSFRLPGESQKIDRMMETFAKRFVECNPGKFKDSDTAYVLAFATIMLNTSLHNPSIKDRMALEQFIKMNRGIDQGGNLPDEFLTSLYEDIRTNEFAIPDQEQGKLEIFVDSEFKGWLKKEGGRKKSWHRRWFILSNSCLYYFENEAEKTPKGTIPLENLDVEEVFDPKRPFLFEVRKQAGNEETSVKAAKVKSGKLVQGHHSTYRLQASSQEEMERWIRAIRASMTKDPIFYQLFQQRKEKFAA